MKNDINDNDQNSKNKKSLSENLLDLYQKNFPINKQPFLEIAKQLNVTEEQVINFYQEQLNNNIISRIGPIFAPHQAGLSTLAAMQVPADKADHIALIINTFPEVNHNYLREDEMNLWFVITAENEEHLSDTINKIEIETGYEVLDLRLEKEFRIDLGFPLFKENL